MPSLTSYSSDLDYSSPAEVPERTGDADIIIVNKVPVNEDTVGTAEKLRLVCVTATGTNNLDKGFLEKRGIAWRNVAGYSTETVAQHTFSLLFYLWEHMGYYDGYVKSGRYAEDIQFTHFEKTFFELKGKKWGIVGLGAIGRRVAEIAAAFGCEVGYYSTSGKNHTEDYREQTFEELLKTSDIISIHAPLNEDTEGLFDAEAFGRMKDSALLLNLGRGPIVVEKDLAEALTSGRIAGAGLDVLCREPMDKNSPLYAVRQQENLVITPHIAWASVEARQRLMKIIEGQIREWMSL